MLEHDPLKRFAGTDKSHDETVRTVCRECTAGCGLLAYLKDGKIVDVQGDENDPFSRGRLCARGIAFHQGLDHPERINGIMQRKSLSESFQPGDEWEKTLDVLAERLRKIRARYGPRSLMIGCDPEAGLDFFIGAMRFARLWGTPDVFHPLYAARGISAPIEDAAPSAPRSADWGESRCILLVEADLAATHPVTFGRLMDARDRGVEIIALDSRYTPTMSKADAPFRIRPKSGNRFALALMKAMIEENPYSTDWGASIFNEFEAWKASFDSIDYDDIEKMTGLATWKVKEIARRLGAKNPVTVITGKRLSHRQNSGIWRTMAAATGWDKMRGGGWYPLDAGLPPFMLFGDIDKVDPRGQMAEGGDSDESAGIAEDPENPVKALVSSGNCLHDFMAGLRPAAEGTELNIHFGAFPNETLNLAHFVIPATLRPERETLAFSSDRAIRWAGRVVQPAGQMRSGLDFWAGLAQRLGDVRHSEWKTYFPWINEDGSADIRSFYAWLLEQSPYTGGAVMEKITAEDADPLFWPVDSAQSGSAAQRKIDPLFAPAGLSGIQAGERELFPLTCLSTRLISRSGDADNFRPLTRDLEDVNAVQIHPETAKALGVESGDEVLVHGPGETIEASAWITRMVPAWMIWSARRLGSDCAVICKKGESREEASRILKEFLK